MTANPERTVKIIVVGNSNVGKTSLLYRFCQQTFHDKITSTIGKQSLFLSLKLLGCDFNTKTIEIDGKRIKLQIWDTAGQEKTSSSPPSFFRDCEGAIITYSVTDRESFARIQTWLKQVNDYGGKHARKILVGNKNDEKAERKVSEEEGKALAEANGGMKFFETSAKEDLQVTEAFYGLAKEIKEKILDKEVNIPVKDNITIHNKPTMSCWESFLDSVKSIFFRR